MDDLIREKIQFDNDRKIVKEWKASKPQYVKDSEKRIASFQAKFRNEVNPLLKKNRKEKRIEIVKRKIHLFDGVEYEMTQSKKIQLQTVYRNVAFGSTLIEPQKATNRIDIR
jgi:uncharacterized protein YcbK (DUF882 family)|tara:strand:- start:928 stop:1263 length:336 start_codon:yes stop_codon:yes gene_type:complete